MSRWLIPVAALFFLLSVAAGGARRPHLNVARYPAMPPSSSSDSPVKDGETLPPYDKIYTFDQFIDHNNPSLGTFKQRYCFSYEYYEKDGPIILSTREKLSLVNGYSGYVTNLTMNGVVAQTNKGAAVMIEHRFFGQSNPFGNLSEESFRVHILEQAIDDLVYFAKTAVLPMPEGGHVSANNTPWLLFGGSYSGALTSWTMTARPDVFWAGYASSAVVEAISYFWVFEAQIRPNRRHMPKNCSADVQRVIHHMDLTFIEGSQAEKDALKAQFGMSNVTHLDDVASALRIPLNYWQDLQPTTGPGSSFAMFCDALEVKNGVSAPAAGWGLEYALEAFGNYMKQFIAQNCVGTDVECLLTYFNTCLGTHDKDLAFWHDITLDNPTRSWLWFWSTVGYWQDGAPDAWPSIVTRLVTPAYDEVSRSDYFFPETFPTETSAKPKTSETNFKYQGWDTVAPRLFFANGERDPWRDATVSSDFTFRKSTPENPIAVSDAFHCSDMIIGHNIDSTVAGVQELAVKQFIEWVKEYKTHSASTAPASVTSATGSKSTGEDGMKPPLPNAWARPPPFKGLNQEHSQHLLG
ncbi:hypothetical protein BOTBODRAFT_59285 [Botryobasidium botryosum FD-172 SS1]|uniref:Peptidase S28 n=1 Tax=Botryobasidium botryosum (strain FD-172 SS1) TaxID=930990 RepID=A0A067LZ77_BOTB1|nr:hypothetical protein BOTBODRAFT_59285 [Botryobasidium botryosum FD-172 SS1]